MQAVSRVSIVSWCGNRNYSLRKLHKCFVKCASPNLLGDARGTSGKPGNGKQETETGNWAKGCVGRDETTVCRYLVHKHQGGLGAHCDLVYEQKGRAMGLEFHLHVTKQSQHSVLISSHQSRLFSYHFIVGGDSLERQAVNLYRYVRSFLPRRKPYTCVPHS